MKLLKEGFRKWDSVFLLGAFDQNIFAGWMTGRAEPFKGVCVCSAGRWVKKAKGVGLCYKLCCMKVQ